jgi:hypothetical protein
MVGVMVCMKKTMAVFMYMGEGTVFSVFAIMPMVVNMRIVIMTLVGDFIMVVAVAMGWGVVRMIMVMTMIAMVRMLIMAVGPVIFFIMVMAVIIGMDMRMFIRGMGMP